MIDNQVETEIEMLREFRYVGPVAAGGIDPAIIDDGKAVVGGIGEKRQ